LILNIVNHVRRYDYKICDDVTDEKALYESISTRTKTTKLIMHRDRGTKEIPPFSFYMLLEIF